MSQQLVELAILYAKLHEAVNNIYEKGFNDKDALMDMFWANYDIRHFGEDSDDE